MESSQKIGGKGHCNLNSKMGVPGVKTGEREGGTGLRRGLQAGLGSLDSTLQIAGNNGDSGPSL